MQTSTEERRIRKSMPGTPSNFRGPVDLREHRQCICTLHPRSTQGPENAQEEQANHERGGDKEHTETETEEGKPTMETQGETNTMETLEKTMGTRDGQADQDNQRNPERIARGH